VLSTLRYAADADYGIIVAHDCCSDSDPDVHEILVKKVFVRAATVVTSDVVVEALGQPAGAPRS
jgi:nicotinamidase-related amidase